MKNILILFILFISGIAFGQGLQNLEINPNQSKNKQYIGISVNGRHLLSNTRKPYDNYETRGHYNSYLLSDVADAIGRYLGIVTLQQLNDSLSGAGGGFFVESTATTDVTQDADGNSLHVVNADSILLNGDLNYIESTSGDKITVSNQVVVQSSNAITLSSPVINIDAQNYTGTDGAMLVIDTTSGQIFRKQLPPYDNFVAIFTDGSGTSPVLFVLDDFENYTVDSVYSDDVGIYFMRINGYDYTTQDDFTWQSATNGTFVAPKFVSMSMLDNFGQPSGFSMLEVFDSTGTYAEIDGYVYIEIRIYNTSTQFPAP